MFAVVLSAVALTLVVWLFTKGSGLIKSEHCNDCEFGGWLLRVLATIIIFVVVMPNACTYSEQIDDFTRINALEAKIKLSEQKRDALSGVVRTELSKYPELEQKLIGDIKPEIFLNFPELKSNTTMIEMLKQLVALQNEVYQRRDELIDIQRVIFAREVSPWVVWVKSYNNQFGQPNPVTLR